MSFYICCMTYAGYEKYLRESLQHLYDDQEAVAITDWVMEDLTGYSRMRRRQLQSDEIPEEQFVKLETAQEQLLKHKPLQYVLGSAPFCGMQLLVNESVLIPRPETEELVEWMVQMNPGNVLPLQILDIGTGSGCIAVALKKRMPAAIVHAIDISPDALQIARKNAALNETEVRFQEFDFLDETHWHQLPHYHVIISNPPYIPAWEKGAMDKNVTDWEPDIALFVPDEDPILFYKKIAAFGKIHLQYGGTIFLETHSHYAGAVQEVFMESGYTTEMKKDMHGNERMVKAVNRQS